MAAGIIVNLHIDLSFQVAKKDALMVIQINEEVLAIHRKATHVVWIHQISFEEDAKMKALVC
jgi:hypothetical protein